MIYLWTAMAGGLAVSLEVMYRRGWGWQENWFVFIPMAILLSYGISKALQSTGPSYLIVIAGFSLTTLTLRVVASHFLLGEAIVKGNIAAIGCLVVAVVAGNVWR